MTVSPTTLHYGRRLSWGLTTSLAAGISATGGGRPWLVSQLDPTRVADAPGDAVADWYPSLARSPQELFDRQVSGTEGAWMAMQDLSRWTVARRLVSTRQVQEVMVDLWSNLLHVPLLDDQSQFYRIDYDRVIRTLALTSFERLLQAAVTHPAMGLYLDNASSTKVAPNENLGRELLELHTVGSDAGYTEADVRGSARLLTGYRVDLWYPAFQAFYDTTRHWTGPVSILGFSHPNDSPDGRVVTQAYLSYLARHKATAKRIARRLCVRLVGDSPSDGLVATVAKAYTDHGTAIVPTLLALVDHPEFLASAGRKIRAPMDDYTATVRALGVTLVRPTSDLGFARIMLSQYRALGQAPYEWPAPNGFPSEGTAWCSTGRLLTSMDAHYDLAGQYYPTKDVIYRALSSWLPPLPATLDAVLTHVGSQLLVEAPRPALRNAVAQALGMSLDHQLTVQEGASYWTVRTILASLLDSPQHLTR